MPDLKHPDILLLQHCHDSHSYPHPFKCVYKLDGLVLRTCGRFHEHEPKQRDQSNLIQMKTLVRAKTLEHLQGITRLIPESRRH